MRQLQFQTRFALAVTASAKSIARSINKLRRNHNPLLFLPSLLLATIVLIAGCTNAPLATSNSNQGPAPLREPPPEGESNCNKSYEDALTGGQVFTMYCSYCHNAPSLAERPYSQFRNVAAHMRVRANLTGKEYDKLMVFVRRWHDVPSPNQADEPTPKRFFYPQPIPELRPQKPTGDAKPPELVAPQAVPKGNP